MPHECQPLEARRLVGIAFGSNCFKVVSRQHSTAVLAKEPVEPGTFYEMAQTKAFQLLWAVITIKRATFLSNFLTCTLHVHLTQFAILKMF